MSDTPFDELSAEEQAEIRLGQELLAKYPKRLQATAADASTSDLPPGVTLQDGGATGDVTQRPDTTAPMDWQAMSNNIADFLATQEKEDGAQQQQPQGQPQQPQQQPIPDQPGQAPPPQQLPQQPGQTPTPQLPQEPPQQLPQQEPAQPTPQQPAAGEEFAPPTGYVHNTVDPYTGNPVSRRVDDATVQQALDVLDWANNLPSGASDTFDAILNGQAAAVPRADLDQFYAWQASKSVPEIPQDPNFDPNDPQAKALQDLRQELVNLKAQVGQAPSPQELAPQQHPQQYPQQSGFDPQQQAQIQAFTDRFYAAAENYAQHRLLTPEEKSELLDAAIRSEIVPYFARQESRINPATGRAATQADAAVVANKAMDHVLYQNPQLHQAVLQRLQAQQQPQGQPPGQQFQQPGQAPIPGQAPTPQPQQPPTVPGTNPVPNANGAIPQPGTPTASVTNIEAKRARAGSLATAPSAAVPHVPQSVTDMNQQQLVESMAAFIDAQTQAQ